MNLKIECPCGQKIAFDVEPENGAMPCELPCPSCQADITGLANTEIQRQSAVVATSLPPPPPAPARLRVNVGAAHAPAPVTEAAPAVPEPPASSKPVATALAAAAASAPLTGGDEEAGVGSFLLGVVGVFAGTLAGLLVWYLLAKAGLTMRLLAVLVGAGAGLGGRFFCRGGDKGLGGVAAVIAVLAMFFGGAITLNKTVVDRVSLNDKELREAYDDDVKSAKLLVKEVPTGSDAEIRAYLAKEQGAGAEITAEDVAEFRTGDEFNEAKDLAAGKITYAAYAEKFRKDFKALTGGATDVATAVGAVRMLSVWLIALVGGTAYKLAAG